MEAKHYLKITLILHLILDAVEMGNVYESYRVKEEHCPKEGLPGFETNSRTECLLRCGMIKCMNALMREKTCFCTDQKCTKNHGDGSSEATALFFEGPGLQQLTTQPICYLAKDDSPATFVVPKSGRIKHFKLRHVSGSVTCHTAISDYNSKWGCGHTDLDNIMTVITDDKDNIITFHGELSSKGYIHMPGENAQSQELFLKMADGYPYEVKKGQELRVWYTEDITDGGDFDNGGKHCVHVFGKYC